MKRIWYVTSPTEGFIINSNWLLDNHVAYSTMLTVVAIEYDDRMGLYLKLIKPHKYFLLKV